MITLTVSAVPDGCGPFASSCTASLVLSALAQAYTLNVATDGDGSGIVVSDVPGIECGTTCSALLGGTVVLTSTPDAGSLFVGWTGCDSATNDQCTVTLGSDRDVTATFDLIRPVPASSPLSLFVIVLLLAMVGLTALRIRI